MSETIVNRTPETVGQQIERQRLETAWQELHAVQTDELVAEARQANVSDPAEVEYAGETIPVSELPEGAVPDNTPVTAEAQRAGQIGQIEIPVNMTELFSEALKITAAAPRDPDVKVLKAQVIAAFKHLGLDTRKFFGV